MCVCVCPNVKGEMTVEAADVEKILVPQLSKTIIVFTFPYA